MPKKPTRSEEESYRVMFFVISSLTMLSCVWLLYQEFVERRPWNTYQLAFFDVEAGRAQKNLESEEKWLAEGVQIVLDEDGEEEEVEVAPQIAKLEQTIAELEGKIVNSDRYRQYQELKGKLATAQIGVQDAEMMVAFAKAEEDEFYYYYRNAKHHADDNGETKYGATVSEIQARVAEREIEYTAAVAARDAIVDDIAEIDGELRSAKKALEGLRGGYVIAKNVADAVDDSLIRPEIQQYWNQDIDLVDRCHSCHFGIDKCGYTAPEEILNIVVASNLELTSAELRKRYCITREEAAQYLEVGEEILDTFGEDEELTYADVKDRLPVADDPVMPVAKELMEELNAARSSHHKRAVTLEDAASIVRTHPHRDPLLRKHPGGIYGCTTCHYGQGRQTKGIGLNLLKADNAPFTHARRDHYWLSQILEVKNHQVESSCFNCHKYDYELEYAPNLNKARKLVTFLGCTGCHPLGTLDSDRKHGPTLKKVGSKMNTDWLAQWIQYPKSLRPRTRMPQFWPEVGRETPPGERELLCNIFDYNKGAALSPAKTEDCTEKRDREVGYLTAFLNAKSEAITYAKMPASASAARGDELFHSIGCMGCHNLGEWDGASTLPGTEDRDLAPNLSNIGDKIKQPGWIFSWVKNPKNYWHETRMPSLRLTDAEAWDITAFLVTQKTGSKINLPAGTLAAMEADDAVEKGEKLVAWYGCFGCHDIEGFENRSRVGAELVDFGSKPRHKLDFGDVPEFVSDHHAQNWEAWTRRKVSDPRVYRYERVETRMPQFDLSPSEVDSVTLFLKGQNSETAGWPSSVMAPDTPNLRAVQRGYEWIDAYNCRGCHAIDGTGLDVDGDRNADGGAIYKWFADNPDERFRAPPRLHGLGKKLYPDWLFGFLKEPYKLRENFKIRMPTFQFSDQVAGDLVAHFAAKSKSGYPYVAKTIPKLTKAEKAQAAELFAAAQCLLCHNLGGKSKDPKQIAPSLRLSADRLQYDWLFDWLKDPAAEIPGVAMPGFFVPDDDNPGEYITPLPKYADGDWRKQIELLRAYVIGLGENVGEVASAD